MSFEAAGGGGVGQNYVAQLVRQLARYLFLFYYILVYEFN